MMPCGFHPEVSVDDCVFCETDGDVVKVHGPADPLDADVGATVRLMAIADMAGPNGNATIIACMSWRIERGDALHRLPAELPVRTCPCGRKTLMPRTCSHCNLAKIPKEKRAIQ